MYVCTTSKYSYLLCVSKFNRTCLYYNELITILCFLGPDGVAKLEFELPPKEVMSKLLDNIEAQLPREDHVKYDSRAKKLDWEKIRVDGYNPEQCKKLWYYVQDRYLRINYC